MASYQKRRRKLLLIVTLISLLLILFFLRSLDSERSNKTRTIVSQNPTYRSIRGAFYYAWYPEQWVDAGRRYNPTIGIYDSSDINLLKSHIEQLKFANVDVGIYSWWGVGSKTDERFKMYLMQADENNFSWALYYELDWNGSRSESEIQKDIDFIAENYFVSKAYLHLENKPVVFVYMPIDGSCKQVDKWTGIKQRNNLYISMMDVPNWWDCNNVDSWHGYKPDSYLKNVSLDNLVYSMSVSAGFWSAWEREPRLERDFSKWESGVLEMVSKNPKWQLVYFNEFGEGTNIEPSDARCELEKCWDYLDVLNKNN